jgi:hypothetical protein
MHSHRCESESCTPWWLVPFARIRAPCPGRTHMTQHPTEIDRRSQILLRRVVLGVWLVAEAVVEGFVDLIDLFALLADGVLAGVTGGDPAVAA